MVTWLPVPWLKFLTYGSLNPCASTLKSHAHSQPICAQSVHMYVLSVHVHLLSVHVHLLSVHLCPLSVHMRPLYLLCPLNAHVFPCLQMFFPFPTDSDVRLDPFTSLNTMCVQHIMVKMCGRESFALTHASWGFGDGDPSLLLIAFCLPLIAWLLLPSSLSPTNVHSFLMGSGFSLCAISIHLCLTFISSSATKSPTAGRSLHRKNSPAQAVPCLHVSPARLAGSWAARPDEHT